MADAAVVAQPEAPRSQFEPVAGALHTVVLLAILTGITVLGYFSVHRGDAVQYPSHLRFYLPTLVWEWLAFGYIYWGVRRRGKTFQDIAGPRWKNATEFFRDVGIAIAAWIAAVLILNVVTRLLHATGSLEAARRLAPQGVLEDVVWIALATTAGFARRQFSAVTCSGNSSPGFAMCPPAFCFPRFCLARDTFTRVGDRPW